MSDRVTSRGSDPEAAASTSPVAVPELRRDPRQARVRVDLFLARADAGRAVPRPNRRDVRRRARREVQGRTVLVARDDADVDFRLLIADQHSPARPVDGALNHRNAANPLQGRRRIRSGSDDHEALDDGFEPANVAGRERGLRPRDRPRR